MKNTTRKTSTLVDSIDNLWHEPAHLRLDHTSFLRGGTRRPLLLANIAIATLYFLVIAFAFQHGNNFLFGLLIAGEAFHLFQIYGLSHSIWRKKLHAKFDTHFVKPVDVFITVCGEPVEIVRETALAALAMDYPDFRVYLLNDGYVAKKDNWKEIISLAKELKIDSITRKVPGGAKAGNINHAMSQTKSPYIVIFDADHVPHSDFLQKTMGYFVNPRMGFVQSPQFYKNQKQNFVTQTAWDQQALFFGPIMAGKNRTNSAFMCGTNMVLSREAILEAGGMCEFNIAEDFLTSLFVHAKKWSSVYVLEVLAEGLAPEDFLSYYKQQFRWTRGSLEVIFKYNPLLMRGLSWSQRLQYLVSASYYLSGVVVLIDMLIPLVYLFFGVTPIMTSTMTLALIFLPFITLNLYAIQRSSNATTSFMAIAFSLSSFYIQLTSIAAILTKQKTAFTVTPKSQQQGNFVRLVIPQLVYIGAALIGLLIGFHRDGLSASFMANLSWVVLYVVIFAPFIGASLPQRAPKTLPAKAVYRPGRLTADHGVNKETATV